MIIYIRPASVGSLTITSQLQKHASKTNNSKKLSTYQKYMVFQCTNVNGGN